MCNIRSRYNEAEDVPPLIREASSALAEFLVLVLKVPGEKKYLDPRMKPPG